MEWKLNRAVQLTRRTLVPVPSVGIWQCLQAFWIVTSWGKYCSHLVGKVRLVFSMFQCTSVMVNVVNRADSRATWKTGLWACLWGNILIL